MSLRLIPTSAHPSTHTQTQTSAPSAPGLHDTLRSTLTPNPTNSTTTPTSATSTHPLEHRLQNWAQTQEALKLESLRRTFGMAEPIRRGMELKICEAGEFRPAVLGGKGAGGGGVHCDVLRGREAEVGWEDVFDGDALRDVPDFHTEMEARGKMNW